MTKKDTKIHCTIVFLSAKIIYRRSVKKSLLQGFAVSLSRAAFLGVYSASFRLAAHLVTQGRISVLGVLRFMILCVLVIGKTWQILES